jgi:hypothetical protein
MKGVCSFSREQEYEGASKSFRTGRLERELQTVHFSPTRRVYVAILWISLVSSVAITLCVVAFQRVFIVVSAYFVIDSVRKLLDTPTYIQVWIWFSWNVSRSWHEHPTHSRYVGYCQQQLTFPFRLCFYLWSMTLNLFLYFLVISTLCVTIFNWNRKPGPKLFWKHVILSESWSSEFGSLLLCHYTLQGSSDFHQRSNISVHFFIVHSTYIYKFICHKQT